MIASIPREHRGRRDQVYRSLRWGGFGIPAPAVCLSPHPDRRQPDCPNPYTIRDHRHTGVPWERRACQSTSMSPRVGRRRDHPRLSEMPQPVRNDDVELGRGPHRRAAEAKRPAAAAAGHRSSASRRAPSWVDRSGGPRRATRHPPAVAAGVPSTLAGTGPVVCVSIRYTLDQARLDVTSPGSTGGSGRRTTPRWVRPELRVGSGKTSVQDWAGRFRRLTRTCCAQPDADDRMPRRR